MTRILVLIAAQHCGGPDVPGRILTLLQSDQVVDPQGEIRGHALEMLWPERISADQLFSLLRPSDERYAGSYAYFLFTLPQSLKQEHLLAALTWATEHVQTLDPVGGYRESTLVDAIMFKAWEVFDDPGLSASFVEHIEARLKNYAPLLRGTDLKANRAFVARLETDSDRRWSFISLLCQRQIDRSAAWTYVSNGLVRKEDFDRLIANSPGGHTPDLRLSEQSLCSFICSLFDKDDNSQFECLYEASKTWPLLRVEHKWLLDVIGIDSAEAESARHHLQQRKALLNRRPPATFPDLPAEIENLLCRAEEGEWHAWWRLIRVLTLEPESHHYGDDLSYFIIGFPGWERADESLRHRIIETASRYLDEASTTVEARIAQRPGTFQRSDVAALRAFLLLFQVAPDRYRAIAPAIWKKWAPVIVGLPRKGVVDRSPEVATILKDALAYASTEFVEAVRRIISVERTRRRGGESSDRAGSVVPFWILEDLEDCWADNRLKDTIFEELHVPDLDSDEYAALLAALLKNGHRLAIDHGLDRIADESEETSGIAAVLLSHAPAQVWSVLWPKLTENEVFARALLLKMAGGSYQETPFYVALETEAVADLYLLMVRLFPPEDEDDAASGLDRPLDMIPRLRDDAVRYLAATGTTDAVHALRRLVAARPDIPLLPFELSRGEEALRLKSWSPLTVNELFALTDHPGSNLITSYGDLLETLVDTIGCYAEWLHGAQAPVQDIWHRQGTTQLYRPIDENGFSDHIIRYLQQKLQAKGIFANREVEVKRRQGAPVGQRTDILVNAVRKTADSHIDAIAAVIEVKGCWNDEVFTAMDEQLVRRYMADLRAPVGIFLVGCFYKAQWDPKDRRRQEAPAMSVWEVQQKLDGQAAAVPAGIQVRAMVLDIRLPGA